jgi:hypothetical protein
MALGKPASTWQESERKWRKTLNLSALVSRQTCTNATLIHAVMVLVLDLVVDPTDTDDGITKSTDELQYFVKSA